MTKPTGDFSQAAASENTEDTIVLHYSAEGAKVGGTFTGRITDNEGNSKEVVFTNKTSLAAEDQYLFPDKVELYKGSEQNYEFLRRNDYGLIGKRFGGPSLMK